MTKNKRYALELLKAKINGERIMAYEHIGALTGYSEKQLRRFVNEIEDRGIEAMLVNGNTGKPSNRSAGSAEVQYILNFKKQYPNISIAQFMDFYHEDVIFNVVKSDDVSKYGLKVRSYSFFKSLYKKNRIKSPRRHRCFKGENAHPLREPSDRRGVLVVIDGTPYDWLGSGQNYSLHMAIDDATGDVLAGWFCPTECLVGYCHMLKILVTKHGIPENIYSDKHTILKNPTEGYLTQFGRMCEELGINMIFAHTPQARGKIERMNGTIQGRLLNDIKRKDITTYEQLNSFFNNQYAGYLNKKFAYEPKEKETEFVTLDKNFDLSNIICLKAERKILDGCAFATQYKYYQLIDDQGEIVKPRKGVAITVHIDVFDGTVRANYKGTVYNTKLVYVHKKAPLKKQQIIENQKQLNQYLKNKKKEDV